MKDEIKDIPVLSEEEIEAEYQKGFDEKHVGKFHPPSLTKEIKIKEKYGRRAIATAQRNDTVLRMEKRCQKRIEGIFERIERNPFQYFKATWGQFEQQFTGDVEVREKEWLALKSKALKEKEV